MRIIVTLSQLALLCAFICAPAFAQTPKNTKKKEDNVQKIILQLGTEGAYPPFSYYNAKSELKGFDIDLGNALCARMKYDCEWQVYDWQNLTHALSTKKIQAIISSKTLETSISKSFFSTTPYYKPYYVVAHQHDTHFTSTTLTDLISTNIGVLKGTQESTFMHNTYKGSRIKQYAQLETAYYALSRREIDFLVIDYAVVSPWLAAKGDGRCCIFKPFNELNAASIPPIKIWIHEEASLVQSAMSSAITAMKEDGELLKIAQKYNIQPEFIINNQAAPYN